MATYALPRGLDSGFRDFDARGNAAQKGQDRIGAEQVGGRIPQNVEGQFLAV